MRQSGLSFNPIETEESEVAPIQPLDPEPVTHLASMSSEIIKAEKAYFKALTGQKVFTFG